MSSKNKQLAKKGCKCKPNFKCYDCNRLKCEVPYLTYDCNKYSKRYCCINLAGCAECCEDSSCEEHVDLGYLVNDRFQEDCPDLDRDCTNKCPGKRPDPCKNPEKCCKTVKCHKKKAPCHKQAPCHKKAPCHKEEPHQKKKPCCGSCAKGEKCDGSDSDTSKEWRKLCKSSETEASSKTTKYYARKRLV